MPLGPQKKQKQIFTDFIEEFRNRVVKEYRSAVGWRIEHDYGEGRDRVGYPITQGAFQGQDFPTVVNEAIDWWRAYIEELEGMI
jgi:hypothetical protein